MLKAILSGNLKYNYVVKIDDSSKSFIFGAHEIKKTHRLSRIHERIMKELKIGDRARVVGYHWFCRVGIITDIDRTKMPSDYWLKLDKSPHEHNFGLWELKKLMNCPEYFKELK